MVKRDKFAFPQLLKLLCHEMSTEALLRTVSKVKFNNDSQNNDDLECLNYNFDLITI